MRRNHGQKELDKLQIVKRENDKLKKEIGSLRKQLARIDLDRYDHIKNIVDEHYSNEIGDQNTQDMLKKMKNEWKCHSCNNGFLEINLYIRVNETFYYRKCGNCEKRTASKKYNPDEVQGIIKQMEEKDRPIRKKDKSLKFK
mgnify:CR=1 FL=1